MTKLPPIIQIVGYSGSGKTTLLCALLRQLTGRGMTVATLKHHGHLESGGASPEAAALDLPDKDTWLHLQAGAAGTGASSPSVSAVWTRGECGIEELARRLPPADLILAEGFKRADYPKWVLLRDRRDLLLLDELSNVIGISAGFPYVHATLPVMDRNDAAGIAECVAAAARSGDGDA